MAVGFPAKTNFATGDVLTATNMNDITGTLNLLQSAQYAAGKNKIINGDFFVNQRNFTTTSDLSGTNVYTVDRMAMNSYLGAQTTTVETFTPGTAPAGYELKSYLRTVTTSQSISGYCLALQKIEDVRNFAGQTVTFSFLAKAASGTPKVALFMRQNFGSGGSPSSSVDVLGGTVTLSTSWARYSVTVAMPSISGKTIGTTANTSCLEMNIVFSGGTYSFGQSIGAQNNTFEHTAWQLEAASTASPFQTASGSVQGELALCQRYYYRTSPTASGMPVTNNGGCITTTIGQVYTALPVTMRANPSAMEYSAINWYNYGNNVEYNTGTFTLTTATPNLASVRYTHGTAVFTAGQSGAFVTAGASSYIAFTAEL